MFTGSPDDFERLIGMLAEQGGVAAGAGLRAVRELRRGGSVVLVSVPGRGVVGATFASENQPPGPLPFGLRQQGNGPPGDVGPAMEAVMEQVMRAMVERFEEEQAPAVPPATESIRDALPRVVVTKEDLMDSTNSKCSVCLEEYKAGSRATRMFCGHLFCTNCIREWLRVANSCPVCRYELATDSQEYEQGRRERMRERQARLKEGELRHMRVPELRRLMRALGVSGEGCVEKGDLVRRLGEAPGVHLSPDPEKQVYDECELRSLELPLLRSLMERHRLLPLPEDRDEEKERAEALRRFASAGWMRLDPPQVAASAKSSPSGRRHGTSELNRSRKTSKDSAGERQLVGKSSSRPCSATGGSSSMPASSSSSAPAAASSPQRAKPAEEPGRPAEEPGRPAEELVGPDQEPVVPAKEPVGPTLEPAGQAERPGGTSQEPVRPAEESVVPAKEPVGPAQEPAGPAEEPGGTSQEPVGPAEESVVPAKEPVGPAQEPAGPAEGLGETSQELVGPAEDPVGPAKELVGPAKELVRPDAKPAEAHVGPCAELHGTPCTAVGRDAVCTDAEFTPETGLCCTSAPSQPPRFCELGATPVSGSADALAKASPNAVREAFSHAEPRDCT